MDEALAAGMAPWQRPAGLGSTAYVRLRLCEVVAAHTTLGVGVIGFSACSKRSRFVSSVICHQKLPFADIPPPNAALQPPTDVVDPAT